MNENWEIDPLLGKQGRDKITGFVGIITGKVQCLYGCNQYILTSKVGKDGKAEDNRAIVDEGRIEVIGVGIRPKEVKAPSGKKGADSLPLQLGRQI